MVPEHAGRPGWSHVLLAPAGDTAGHTAVARRPERDDAVARTVLDPAALLGITRSEPRWIGGVAGGLATRWNLDPLVVRGLFAASLVLGGIGFLAYGVAWALLPEPDGRIHAERALRGNVDVALVGIGLMVLAGVGPGRWIGLGWVGDGAWGGLRGGGFAIVALAAWIAWHHHRGGRAGARGRGRGPGGAAGGSAGSGATGAGPDARATTSATADPSWGTPSPAATSPAPTVQDLTDPYGSPEPAAPTASRASGSAGTSSATTPGDPDGPAPATGGSWPVPARVRGPGAGWSPS
ncbi:PspC domain-containing protein [Litorihabitans aurantiacus]|uniref:Phage shock protein PspC N-terminal domain-containing protein n=1 Tax=Litorihabitans aurantiacus TaxID=1930061 RepID=A0AA38CUM2_9MICO|nr:PspC domain-containing protein [Litorihabitans aurantiacus]GMA32215.1 hypothetical protein GCM10025875_22070 [Litorihabitans aurantiacus]